jgi:hypothetical protein
LLGRFLAVFFPQVLGRAGSPNVVLLFQVLGLLGSLALEDVCFQSREVEHLFASLLRSCWLLRREENRQNKARYDLSELVE